jgi:hypothetical protein
MHGNIGARLRGARSVSAAQQLRAASHALGDRDVEELARRPVHGLAGELGHLRPVEAAALVPTDVLDGVARVDDQRAIFLAAAAAHP